MKVATALLLVIAAACTPSPERKLAGEWEWTLGQYHRSTWTLDAGGEAVYRRWLRLCQDSVDAFRPEMTNADFEPPRCERIQAWGDPFEVKLYKSWRVVTDTATNAVSLLCLDPTNGIGTAECKPLKATDALLEFEGVTWVRPGAARPVNPDTMPLVPAN